MSEKIKKRGMSLFSALLLMMAATTLFAKEPDGKDPYALMEKVAEDTFSYLKANQDTYKKNPTLLKKVAETNILPYVNVRYAALRVLGTYANKTTKAERDEFTAAFTDYLTSLYAQILIQYTDQRVNIEPAKPIDPKRSIITVRVDIVDGKRPPIALDFKLRKNNSTGIWQGYDVNVEGVSMLDTKASEWQRDLRRNGIGYVTNELKKLAQEPIKEESKS